VDATNIYWMHYVVDGALFTSVQDGTGQRTVTSYPAELKAFAIDGATTYLAYTSSAGGEIASVATGATSAAPTIVATSPYALDIAFDATNLYWPDDTGAPSSIWTAAKTASGGPATAFVTEANANTTETRVAAGMLFYAASNGIHWVSTSGGTPTEIAAGYKIDVDSTYLYWLDQYTATPTAWRLAFGDITLGNLIPTPLVTFASAPTAIAFASDRVFTTSDGADGMRSLTMTPYDGSPATTLASVPIGTNYWASWFNSIAVTPTAVFFIANDSIWKVAR